MEHGRVTIDISEVQFAEKIGAGKFGEVFKGTCRGRTVALKKMNEEYKDLYDELLKEMDALEQGTNPNVVAVLGVVVQEVNGKQEVVALMSEFMDNKDLHTIIHAAKPEERLSLLKKFRVLIDIASGMAWLQGKKTQVIHRDLKPDNILMDANGTCKISDFGLSEIVYGSSQAVHKMEFAGTPVYLAPEAWLNEAVAEKTDVYSYGLIMWEVMTERLPFEELRRKSTATIEEAILDNLRPDISLIKNKRLADLIQACWAEDYGNRPTFQHIISELDEIRLEVFFGFYKHYGEKWTKKWTLRDHVSANEFFDYFFHDEPEPNLRLVRLVVQKLGLIADDNINLEAYSLLVRWFPVPSHKSLGEVIVECASYDWFFGAQDVTDAKGRLLACPNGTYLIRLSSSLLSHPFALSCKDSIGQKQFGLACLQGYFRIVHVRIAREEHAFSVTVAGKKTIFNCAYLPELVPLVAKHFGCTRICPGSPYPVLGKTLESEYLTQVVPTTYL